jgi:hypothetical protein
MEGLDVRTGLGTADGFRQNAPKGLIESGNLRRFELKSLINVRP